VGATAATLLLTAWVSSAGPVGVFARPDLMEFRAKAPGEEYGTPDVADRGQRAIGRTTEVHQSNDTLVQVIDWVLKALVVVVVLAVLVAVARVIVARWQSREVPGEGEDAAVDTLPAALLRQARASEELLAEGPPGNGVIAAWVGLEEAVRSAGVRDDRSRTSEELVTVVLRSYAVDRGSLQVLAELYREARFSRHEVTEPMRERAREALQQVQADLGRALLATAGRGAP
jgi:hypothetical protein